VPLLSDAEFMRLVDSVVGGTGLEEFTDVTLTGEQFALF
jgi:DNA polymerase-3 subunit epsilon